MKSIILTILRIFRDFQKNNRNAYIISIGVFVTIVVQKGLELMIESHRIRLTATNDERAISRLCFNYIICEIACSFFLELKSYIFSKYCSKLSADFKYTILKWIMNQKTIPSPTKYQFLQNYLIVGCQSASIVLKICVLNLLPVFIGLSIVFYKIICKRILKVLLVMSAGVFLSMYIDLYLAVRKSTLKILINEIQSKINTKISETFCNAELIKYLNMENHELEELRIILKSYQNEQIKYSRIACYFNFLNRFVFSLVKYLTLQPFFGDITDTTATRRFKILIIASLERNMMNCGNFFLNLNENLRSVFPIQNFLRDNYASDKGFDDSCSLELPQFLKNNYYSDKTNFGSHSYLKTIFHPKTRAFKSNKYAPAEDPNDQRDLDLNIQHNISNQSNSSDPALTYLFREYELQNKISNQCTGLNQASSCFFDDFCIGQDSLIDKSSRENSSMLPIFKHENVLYSRKLKNDDDIDNTENEDPQINVLSKIKDFTIDNYDPKLKDTSRQSKSSIKIKSRKNHLCDFYIDNSRNTSKKKAIGASNNPENCKRVQYKHEDRDRYDEKTITSLQELPANGPEYWNDYDKTALGCFQPDWNSNINNILSMNLHTKNQNGTQSHISPLLEFKNVFLEHTRSHFSCGITFRIKRNAKIAIIGDNGCGKSTFLQSILKLRNFKGSIIFNGADINTLDTRELRSSIGYLPQQPYIFDNTVNYNICFGNTGKKLSNFGKLIFQSLEPFKDKNALFLSGGEKKKISICRFEHQKYDLYLLDEPFSGLDPSWKTSIIDYYLSLQSTVIMTLHEMPYLNRFDHVFKIHNNQVHQIKLA